MPKRIQRKRTKGWKMPEGAVYVGRPTKWGNLWRVGMFKGFTAADAIERFRAWITGRAWTNHPYWGTVGGREIRATARRELRGKDLACWCPLDQPCHADVLLEIANSQAGDS